AAGILAQESEHDRVNQRIYELDAELKQNQNVLNLTALEADRSENRVSFNRQRAEELAARAQSRNAQIAESEQRIATLRRTASEAGESLLRLHGEQKQAEEALAHQAGA